MLEIEIGEYVISENRLVLGQVIEIKNNTQLIIRTLLKDGFRHIIPIATDNIKKHSTEKIDLIEEGDYVNGHLIVNEIYGEDDNELYFEIEGGFNKAKYIGEKDIKSIVTKEQFAQVQYEVGD